MIENLKVCKFYWFYQSLLTKSRNKHALEMEAQSHHITFTPHQIDQLYLGKVLEYLID